MDVDGQDPPLPSAKQLADDFLNPMNHPNWAKVFETLGQGEQERLFWYWLMVLSNRKYGALIAHSEEERKYFS